MVASGNLFDEIQFIHFFPPPFFSNESLMLMKISVKRFDTLLFVNQNFLLRVAGRSPHFYLTTFGYSHPPMITRMIMATSKMPKSNPNP